MSDKLGRFEWVVLAMFVLSGASGLIYESMWSHYLGLYLGHAAFAQALVLVIFMGGMALGAWLSSRRAWRNPLQGYAIVEGLIGLAGLVFHAEFVLVSSLTLDTLAPSLGQSPLLPLLQWFLAALLILPQSVLLGMTFPLLTSAFLRRRPDARGHSLGLLYFGNSLGAAAGALIASFVLLPLAGLPGTLLCAGLLNIVIFGVVWLVARRPTQTAARPEPTGADPTASRRLTIVVLGCALGTGLASFVYEIVWIRMLSLVLGSSLHAFELMLSAFILGLAIGGLWIRKRLDRLDDPLRFAGWVQIAMAALAVLSLVVYGFSFAWQSYFYDAIAKTESGYAVFNVVSHVLAMAVMLPATIMAGMTLPLFTYGLLSRGAGEEAIGRVYASNTLGAIAGVLLALHLALPLVGLRWTLGLGALVDLGIGIYLVCFVARRRSLAVALAPCGVAALAIVLVLGLADLDEMSLVSGVFRHGKSRVEGKVEFIEHGRTATIATYLSPDGAYRVLATNGKPDASLATRDDVDPAPDELTQYLVGALPLAIDPDARTVANIGFGSGLTAHAVLGSPTVERVVSIEIESAVLDAARRFGDRVGRAFSDPRGEIHLDDAKVFFARSGARYDVIISEPSNPWVAGVSALFTEEFYDHVEGHLEPGGMLVQWVQLYETEDWLLSTVFKALAGEFEHFALYIGDEPDLIVIASQEPIAAPSLAALRGTELGAELGRVGIASAADIEARFAGDRRYIEALARSFDTTAHSDYFPTLALEGPEARFRKLEAVLIRQATQSLLPLRSWLFSRAPITAPVTVRPSSPLRDRYQARAAAAQFLDSGSAPASLPSELRRDLHYLAMASRDCAVDPAAWQDALAGVAEAVLPIGDGRAFRDYFAGFGRCNLPPVIAAQLALYLAIIDVDEVAAMRAAAALHATAGSAARITAYADLIAAMAHLRRGEHEAALELIARSSAALYFETETELLFRLATGKF